MMALTEPVTPCFQQSPISLGDMSQCFSVHMIWSCSLICNSNPSPAASQRALSFLEMSDREQAVRGLPPPQQNIFKSLFAANPCGKPLKAEGSQASPHKLAEVGGR